VLKTRNRGEAGCEIGRGIGFALPFLVSRVFLELHFPISLASAGRISNVSVIQGNGFDAVDFWFSGITDFCGSRTGIADLYVFLRTAWTGKGFALSSGADDKSSQNAS
jgi:hypothetical protein